MVRCEVDPSFNASPNGPPGTLEVKTLLPQVDGALLVSGTFTSVDGTPRPGMARLTATGALDPAFSHLDTARYAGHNGMRQDAEVFLRLRRGLRQGHGTGPSQQGGNCQKAEGT
jgi:hypothetical protein